MIDPNSCCALEMESVDIYERIVDGWERTETKTGVPYYICHKLQRTTWDHPYLLKTMEELGDYSRIKYAAYRTAFKIRHLQKKFKLDQICIATVKDTFDRHGYPDGYDEMISCTELFAVLNDLYLRLDKGISLTREEAEILGELLQNFMMNLFDVNRTGCIKVMSVKVMLITMCAARLAEKYKAYYNEIHDPSTFISSTNFALFLEDLIQLPDVLHEAGAFGKDVSPAVTNCIQMNSSGVGISEDVFFQWLLKEPQTLVWLPTFHRVAASESIKHEAKCNICKSCPIVGFRYKCLKCFNFDMCQNCFYTGRTKKTHKLKHPIQEYCMATTTKEDTKAFLTTVRNNLSKKYRQKSKLKYLPIMSENQYHPHTWNNRIEPPVPNIHSAMTDNAHKLTQAEKHPSTNDLTEEAVTPNDENKENKTFTVLVHAEDKKRRISDTKTEDSDSLIQQRKELEKFIKQLEDENRQLHQQLSEFRESSDTESNLSGGEPRKKSLPLTPLENTYSVGSKGHERAKPSPIKPEISHVYLRHRSHTPQYSPLSSPDDPEKLSRSKISAIHRYSDSFVTEPCSDSRNRMSYDSLDYIDVSPSHFTLPSYAHSRAYIDEEAEMDNLVHKMEQVFPSNLSYSAYSTTANDEMLQAASTIGAAMSDYVSEAIHTYY
ncbi:dystrophin-like [Mytilus galloprovincialis]|uniref:dystrophin-like n=1 Tax=Mytilus galloprovincialis TaxID=29158 RepID=UPI003F7BA9E4